VSSPPIPLPNFARGLPVHQISDLAQSLYALPARRSNQRHTLSPRDDSYFPDKPAAHRPALKYPSQPAIDALGAVLRSWSRRFPLACIIGVKSRRPMYPREPKPRPTCRARLWRIPKSVDNELGRTAERGKSRLAEIYGGAPRSIHLLRAAPRRLSGRWCRSPR
jgi:hypothetical protein